MAAEAAVGVVVETCEVSDQVEDLKVQLDRLRSFLRYAEARQDEKRDIQVWISQARDLAYEAEDLLEDYAFRIASQRENIHKRTVCFLKECSIFRSIGSKIQKLESKISSLNRSFRDYGIRSCGMEREGSSSQHQLRPTCSQGSSDRRSRRRGCLQNSKRACSQGHVGHEAAEALASCPLK